MLQVCLLDVSNSHASDCKKISNISSPGNHELYSTPKDAESNLRGEAKYQACVSLAREYSILTPEDDFPIWEYTDTNGEVQKAVIALTFTLYDYSFRPAHVSREQALDWAMEEGIRATDETLLHPDPWPTRDEWCAHRISFSEQKLRTAAATGLPLIIVNHWPLRQDTCHIPAVPRFSIWCGTTKTENWHKEFNAKVVVTGHLHVRRTDWIDGVRFEETSLGYPRQWNTAKEKGMTINTVLREILPGPSTPAEGEDIPTKWRYYG